MKNSKLLLQKPRESLIYGACNLSRMKFQIFPPSNPKYLPTFYQELLSTVLMDAIKVKVLTLYTHCLNSRCGKGQTLSRQKSPAALRAYSRPTRKALSSIGIASASKAYHHHFLLPSQYHQHQSSLQKLCQQSNPGSNYKLMIVKKLVKAHLSSWDSLFVETVAHP